LTGSSDVAPERGSADKTEYPQTVPDPFLAETVALLERTPRVVRELLAELPDTWLDTPETADGWTPRDVVGHLISAELDDWIPRAEIMMVDGASRPFEPFDRFAHVERDRFVSLAELIERFAQLRVQSLVRLNDLVGDDDLDRVGLHPEFGAVTMRQHLSTWAVHDLDHVAQIFAALAGSHDADVGPWKAYLGILLRRDQA
jgi:DinB superfamily